MVKGIKTERKIKEKEKRSPDPGHCSGLRARIRARIRSGLNARTFRTFCGLSGLDSYCEDMLRYVCEEGGTASIKSGLK
jgi:hypothetical protein